MFAPVSTQASRPAFNAPLVSQTTLDAADALARAAALRPSLTPASLSLPSRQSDAWRVQMRDAEGAMVSIDVSDSTGRAEITPDRSLSGDRVSQWMRWIHEGSHTPVWWAAMVFLTGVLPPVFAITGILMWLRRRRAMRRPASQIRAGLRRAHPAE
jgi:uncharacterized iron-regulated membrane protein